MSALKMYEIWVKNPVTKEMAKFLGQGETMADAVKDGLSLIGKEFRPKQVGKSRESTTLGVRLPDGTWVNRSIKNFESETAYSPNETP